MLSDSPYIPTGMIPVLRELDSATNLQDELHYHAQSVVVPYQLCRCCQALIAKLEPVLVKLRQLNKDSSKSNAWPRETFHELLPHYQGARELIHGAQEGCHLCFKLLCSRRRLDSGWFVPKPSPEKYEKDIHIQITYDSYLRNEFYEVITYCVAIGQIGNTTHEFDPLTEAIFLDFPPHPVVSSNHAQVSRYTGSAACYQMIQKWLHTCTSFHEQCNVDQPMGRPTRLLDLMFDDTSDVRLVPGDSVAAPYATMSYSWGTSVQLMLLSANHEQFHDRIRFFTLSKTAQDAVTVCRGLSIRYLWIDAMCIVQGADGDFAKESTRMRDIYSGSIVTITAAASQNTSQHFLEYREPLQCMDCKLSTLHVDGREGTVVDFKGCHKRGKFPGSYHIDTRAWFFQERFLSPRSVYFGSQGIHWECRMGVACEHKANVEDQGIHQTSSAQGGLKTMYAKLLSLNGRLDDPHIAITIHEIWSDILETYTEMQLTIPTDRLVAIAGVASIFEARFHMRAVFGLWMESLTEELLWHVGMNARRCSKATKQAPSWSWASMNCRVEAHNAMLSGQTDSTTSCLEGISQCTTVIVPPETGFCVLQPKVSINSMIRLKGKLVPCTITESDTGYFTWYGLSPCPPGPREALSSHSTMEAIHENQDSGDIINRPVSPDPAKTRPMRNIYYPDTKESQLSSHYCLHLRTELREYLFEGASYTLWNYGLVLRKTEGLGERTYERVGLFHECFDHVQIEEVPGGSPRFKVPMDAQYMWKDAGAAEEVDIV
ncbi:heterokaryon incompatibility protein-domain-containing protein [Phaeosphaeria sp. MPI-PUGE-AT-0046c]|nr:heterokaryon incompatibility protein-domain-containing protein [Phaeosphaeria sp. MPI-PUGE-AT-0046c]